ncbi:hypothetical protein [Staphylococcus pettenkoferi]|uniref:hypothetical protein n=1 Tax=Staphylococcus pettenkoferi TaxID=170573 RepID=UPI00227253F4|nr:hypothetical protein [Staphylococcus pettenkoferi]MCY1607223.1 hypothetical protein [Staphylococcus pettenkoferi]
MEPKDILSSFKDGYLEEIQLNYDFLDNSELKNFPFYKALNYLGIKIINTGKLNTSVQFIVLITNNIENEYLDINDNITKKMKKIAADYSNRYKKMALEILKELYPNLNLEQKSYYYITYDPKIFINPETFNHVGKTEVKKQYQSIKDNKNELIKNNDKPKINPFSFLDFDSLIGKVDDEDFTYQMREAKTCYEQQLYLAACCTFSVCLETVLMQILEKHNLKVNDDSTMLNKIGDTLRENKIISKRANNRLLITYSVRNATSHTNKNKVIQNDCEWILKTIEFFVDEYLND